MLLLQYLIFLLQPPKLAPVGLPAPASRGRLCSRTGRTASPYFIAGQAIPLLTHTSCYSTVMVASHRSEPVPSYSSTRGHPLPHLPRLRIVPFLGLAVIHHLGSPCGVVNVVKERLPSKEYYMCRG